MPRLISAFTNSCVFILSRFFCLLDCIYQSKRSRSIACCSHSGVERQSETPEEIFISDTSGPFYQHVFSVYPLPLGWLREYIYLSYYHHQIGSMNYYPLIRVRSWNDGVRCMSLYILMNLWYDRIASWDIRVLVVFARNLTLCHWHAALLLCYVP